MSEPKVFARTMDGLRDALFCELEDIRAGIAGAAEALAFADIAQKVINSVETEAKIHFRKAELEARQQKWLAILPPENTRV